MASTAVRRRARGSLQAQKPAAKQASKPKAKGINTIPLYILIVAFFALYILFQRTPVLSAVFGIVVFLMIIAVIVIEVLGSLHEEGGKKSAIELVAAIVIVIIFWLSLQALLSTPEPINVVPTCSMLPVLHRGDLIAIHGISNATKINAPIVNVNQAVWNRTIGNFSSDFMFCVAYNQSDPASASVQYHPGDSLALYKSNLGGGELVQQSSQTGLIQYSCGISDVRLSSGSTIQEAYTKSITIGNTTINGDKNNSIVVYKTLPEDIFYEEGDNYIVHRVYAIIHSGSNYYVLTKGDNNPGLDIQYGNYPILVNSTENYIEGKVIAVIPYIGYLRLIFSRQISAPAGCNSTMVN